MIECEMILQPEGIDELVGALFDLPVSLRPVSRSDDEDGPRTHITEDAMKKTGSYTGFFWSEKCAYDLSIKSNSLLLYANSEDPVAVEEIFHQFTGLEPIFGYAADTEERFHRNKVVSHKSYGLHEAWVGRDLQRYIPGLFWMTLISHSLIEKHAVEVSKLHDIAPSVSDEAGKLIIRLYDDPSLWLTRADEVDAWCDEAQGFFSKRSAQIEVDRVQDYLEVSEILERYP